MRSSTTLVAGLSLLTVATAVATAAPKKPAAKKPAAATKAGGPIVLGTRQLAGDFGKFGTTYTIGKDAPINFTLRSAEYAVRPFSVDGNAWVPNKDQKVLVLHFTVHNPQPQEENFYWADLRFTAVDAQDKNHEYVQAITREGTRVAVNQNLKPAQKIDLVTAILVPAQGEIPKLIVQREEGAPVIRYDLRGKVKGLPEPIADPADATGATARAEVPAKAGAFYPLGEFDLKLDAVAYTDEALLERELEAGKRYATVTVTIKNTTSEEHGYYWANFAVELIDADGEKADYTQALVKASRNEAAQGKLKPGEEGRFRFFFPVPANVEAKTLKVGLAVSVDGESARTYAFDLASAASGGVTAASN